MYCQLDYLAGRSLVDIKRALDDIPATLNETYERTLREIDNKNWEYARRLLQCVAVTCRPLRVEELADILAFECNGPIPAFHEEYRHPNPVKAVLSSCSTLLSVVEDSQVVQFSHFTVKEFLTSIHFAEKHDTLSSHYHISMTPAHTVITQACLGMLLHLDQKITRDSLTQFPLAEYAAEHWLEHARFEGVSQNAEEGMKQLFDRTKPHLSIWLWLYDPTVDYWLRGANLRAEGPPPPRGTPLHYAAFCGLHDMAKIVATEYPKDVNSHGFNNSSTPLHLASEEGHVDVARMLVESGADMSAQDKDGRTPLHLASFRGHVDVARMLVKLGADVSAQDKDGRTLLHLALFHGRMDVARLLVELGADVSAQDKDGRTLLHRASFHGCVDMARKLVELGADVSAQDKDGRTPLHLASSKNDSLVFSVLGTGRVLVEMARSLVELGANVSAQDKGGSTPLHVAVSNSLLHVDVAQMLVENGANISAQDKDGSTPLHVAVSSSFVHVDVAQMLVEHGADMSAHDKNGRTPLHLASSIGRADVARMLVKLGADMSVHDKYGIAAAGVQQP